MGFYKDVGVGEKFQPLATLENDIRHFFNGLNGFISTPGRHSRESILCKIYSVSADVIEAGTAVTFEAGELIDGAIPARQYQAGDKRWGIVTQDVDPDAFADCIVSGPAEVTISGTGDCAAPAADGLTFTAGSSGAQILCSEGEKAIILLGGGSGSAAPSYNGMHKLVLIASKSGSTTTHKVCVCDGATYDSTTHTSGKSRVEVNGISFDLDAKVFDLSNSTMYIYVHFKPGNVGEESTVQYGCETFLPENHLGSDYYYLVGRAVHKDGSFFVVQEHVGLNTNGVINIAWGRRCNDF